MMFEDAAEKALAFRDERDWAQFHNPKDLAISVSLEASELLEVFQWSGLDLEVPGKADRAREELADVASTHTADAAGDRLASAVSDKIDADGRKYPADKVRGSARKYTEL